MKNRPAVQLLVVGLLAAGTIGLAFWLRPATTAFANEYVAFDYPRAWAVHDQMPGTTGPGQMLAVLGTLPWGLCGESDINCHFEQRLHPGQIEVQVGVRGLLPDGMCGFAQARPDLQGRGPSDPQVVETTYFRIFGRPAIYTRYAVNGLDYYVSDEWRTWLLAPWDSVSQMISIDAKFRGPNSEAITAQLDRLVASITLPSHWDAPAGGDCGAPFPATSGN